MELALLIGANPQRCSSCPTVRLVRGTWLIESTGLRNSTLGLSLDGQVLDYGQIIVGDGLRIAVHKDVSVAQLEFLERGTEESITVIAKKVA
jgi:LSD1 subclass zinc finger protein